MTTTTFERSSFLFGVLAVLLAFFLPLYLIHYHQETSFGDAAVGTGEATVGIGVILRATARRLLRSGSSNILRTTLGAYSRAAGRAMTRRLVKLAARVAVGSVTKQAVEGSLDEPEPATPMSNFIAIAVGFVGLIASFWGILLIADDSIVAAITTDRGLSVPVAAMLAGVPMLIYALLNAIAGRMHGVGISFNSAIDGLILQGYFTGAGSFLPMTTDIRYEGTTRQKAWVAVLALGSMYLLHLLLLWIGSMTGIYALTFLSTLFLIYCFVYSFPINPLEGYDIWSGSKLVWFLFWIPILGSFIVNLPADLAEIL